jgi:hypothetical protein
MIKLRGKILIVFMALVYLMGQWGCVLPPKAVSEEVRAQLGKVGIVSGRFIPKIELETPPKGAGEGAVRGAGVWAKNWAWAGRPGGGGALGVLLALAWLALTPVAAVSGAVYGAVDSNAPQVIEEAEANLNKTLAELHMQETLRYLILGKLQNETHYHVVFLNTQGPTSSGEVMDYSAAAKKGIETILEIAVETFGLDGRLEMDPPLAIIMQARAKLIKVRKGTVLYNSVFHYRSNLLAFSEWATNDAYLFRKGIDRGYQNLATQIVETLFLLVEEETWQRSEGLGEE